MRSLALSTLFALGFITQGFSQDYVSASAQFKDEVASFDQIQVTAEPVVVFTGSSSVRLYKNASQLSDKVRIVNTGFGGSTAYGLLTYLEQTVLRFKPKQVFIYEGDNDIAAGRTNATIIAHLNSIFQRIWADLPETQIVFIAAKPSPLRWEKHQQYEALNSAIERWAKREKRLEYADVYSPMLDGQMVREDLFIEDRLHMNEKGYALWDAVIRPM
ncbi:MAG: GDSL-type esterase/lipase family protein, partial [Bacteroidetes bacterium]|nr:GDSL-type esterase/lipase family protein [Bacteroidota bacterium]